MSGREREKQERMKERKEEDEGARWRSDCEEEAGTGSREEVDGPSEPEHSG